MAIRKRHDGDFTKGSLYKALLTMAVPTAVGLIFTMLYNTVDTYFAGQVVGKAALAGITISFPIYYLIMALSYGVSNGATALLSISHGNKERQHFLDLARSGVWLAFGAALFVAVLTPLAWKPLLQLTGAEDEALVYALSYINIISYGAIFTFLNGAINAILFSMGDTRSNRNFSIAGFFLNALLDPLFLLGWFGLPELGLAGVAYATIGVQMFGTVFLTFRVRALYRDNEFSYHEGVVSYKVMKELIYQGFPATVNMGANALGVFITNYFIMGFAPGATVIAGYGGGLRAEQFALMPLLGINTAVLTVVGQNYGARLGSRIQSARDKGLIMTLIPASVGVVLIYIFAPELVGIFTSDPQVIAAGVQYLHIELFAFPTYLVVSIYVSSLQAIRKPNFAMVISVYRQIIMPFIVYNLLEYFFGLGILSVWIGIVFNNWTAMIISHFYARYAMRKELVRKCMIDVA